MVLPLYHSLRSVWLRAVAEGSEVTAPRPKHRWVVIGVMQFECEKMDLRERKVLPSLSFELLCLLLLFAICFGKLDC